MIDLEVHFRGTDSQRRRLPAAPAVGTYVYGAGPDRRLFQVDAVVVDGGTINVFAVPMSTRLASELTAAWATWGKDGCTGDPADCTCPACARRRIDGADEAHPTGDGGIVGVGRGRPVGAGRDAAFAKGPVTGGTSTTG
jgi:hypothetical protein